MYESFIETSVSYDHLLAFNKLSYNLALENVFHLKTLTNARR